MLSYNRIITAKIIRTLVLLAIFCMLYPIQTHAAVTGQCYICHTMHNSQNGVSTNIPDTTGANIGWNGSGELAGGSVSSTPANNLLVTNCVGCHSSSTGETIVTIGANIKIPIVYNTVIPTDNILAGGNFYWIGILSDDTKGHNVYGISGPDPNHAGGAPGNENCGGLTTPCHKTLAVAPSTENYNRGGCQGCHYNVYHHNDNGIYRFLSTGHETGGSAAYYVEGKEDSDWEQTTATHNWYKGVDGPVNGGTLAITHSISTYCGGCHKDFHRQDYIGGTSSPWKRHPTDIALPTTGEFAGYDPEVSYDLDAPVAWTTPTLVSKGTPIVMCLSCHRAHGSDQPDMLRWNYDDMIVGSDNGTGCFICHADKD